MSLSHCCFLHKVAQLVLLSMVVVLVAFLSVVVGVVLTALLRLGLGDSDCQHLSSVTSSVSLSGFAFHLLFLSSAHGPYLMESYLGLLEPFLLHLLDSHVAGAFFG